MAKLVVKKGGNKFTELELNEEQEYTIGRDASCDVVLDNMKGISRKHLILKFDGQEWNVEIVSRMNNLVIEGTSVKESPLTGGKDFEVYPFFFSIVEETESSNDSAEESTADVTAPTSKNLPAVRSQSPQDIEDTGSPNSLQPLDDSDATLGGKTHSRILNLSIEGTDSGNDSIVQLDDEGPVWFAGRDPACTIFIDDGHASRNHFKIIRDLDQFFIEDLGSANGTELNGEHLQPKAKYKLVSGDEIKIMSVTLNVEVRDPNFEQQAELASKGLVSANPYFQGFPQNPFPYPMPGQGQYIPAGEEAEPEKKTPLELLKDFDWQKHKMRVMIGAGVIVMLIGLLTDGSDQKPAKSAQKKEASSTSVTFDKLSNEQKAAVKDIYNLAKTYYFGMRYELCISEVKKLHKVIPLYEDSKQLLTNCTNGQEILIRDAARKQKEQKQQEALEKIDSIVLFCQENIDVNTSLSELRTCLSDATELDPANPKVLALIESIEKRDADRQMARVNRQKRAQRIASGKRAYNKAVKLKKENKLNKALKQYERFLTAGYPGLSKEKNEAKREIASVKALLDSKIEGLLNQCESLRSNNQFKDAYMKCDMATKESPGSERAKSMKAQTLSELRKEMKSIYQDSILEESLGNVDAAKEKWKLILKNDIPSDGYYKKAKRKLKKYGEGI